MELSTVNGFGTSPGNPTSASGYSAVIAPSAMAPRSADDKSRCCVMM